MVLMLVLTFLGLIASLGVLVVYQSIKQEGRFGVRFGAPPKCPGCSSPLPVARVPQDGHEAMWGGWTCEACGTKLDKWGKVRT
jgi:hypothetical protein